MALTNTKVKLIGEDGNIFNIMGIVSKTLKRDGHGELAKELTTKIFQCASYDAALQLIMEYVEIVGEDEEED